MLLRVEAKRVQPDIIVLELASRMILGAESQKIETLLKNLLAENERKLVLDLTGVDFIDHTGIGVIAHCFAMAMRADARLRVVGVSDKVQQLFMTTRLDAVLRFYSNVAAACQDFTANHPQGLQTPW